VSHANAVLTPRTRLRLTRLIVEDGWTCAAAAKMFMVAPRTARKWAQRSLAATRAGLGLSAVPDSWRAPPWPCDLPQHPRSPDGRRSRTALPYEPGEHDGSSSPATQPDWQPAMRGSSGSSRKRVTSNSRT
jgi:hypothetical protein